MKNTLEGEEWKSEVQLNTGEAVSTIVRYARLHPTAIAQKVRVVVEHFRRNVQPLLGGQARAMVVTSSGMEALSWSRKMDAYIALRGADNIFESSDVPSERVQLVSRLMKPVLDHRVGRTKWVVLRCPRAAMAQQAAMSTEAVEDFYFGVGTLG